MGICCVTAEIEPLGWKDKTEKQYKDVKVFHTTYRIGNKNFYIVTIVLKIA